jgi:hypothetical protein
MAHFPEPENVRIPLQPTCSKAAMTFELSKSFWGHSEVKTTVSMPMSSAVDQRQFAVVFTGLYSFKEVCYADPHKMPR